MAKISRKKLLKEPDEFLTFSGRALAWSKANTRTIIWAGSAVVLALALVVGIQSYISHRNAQAAADLGRVFAAYQTALAGQLEAKQAELVLQALESVAQEYSASPAGQQARLAYGNLCLQMNAFDPAAKAFAMLADEPRLPDALQPLAHLGLGQALEGQKKFTEAADAYAAAARLAGPNLAAQARLDQARVLEAAGNPGAAMNLYRQLLKEPPDRGLQAAARARLVALGQDPDQAPTPPEVPTSRK
jgi:tetratricopeptide (TPR) repeat protein